MNYYWLVENKIIYNYDYAPATTWASYCAAPQDRIQLNLQKMQFFLWCVYIHFTTY